MRVATSLGIVLVMLCTALPVCADGARWPTDAPARPLIPGAVPVLLAAAPAGNAVVAVGRGGAIVVGRDGKTFRQASAVPTRSTLTGVSFVGNAQGWAVGYDGVILHTTDGGQSWTLQRQAYGSDEVLLGVWFDDSRRGWAVGLFGLLLATQDGGATWTRVALPAGDHADRHLYAIARVGGALLVAAEAGSVLRSADGGATWQAVATGVKGSLWALAPTGAGVIAVGLRGTAVRSADGGHTWQRVATGTAASLTSVVAGREGVVLAGAVDGTLLTSRDGGLSFDVTNVRGRESITAMALRGSEAVLFPNAATTPARP
jgi:photosystem II stability/assembly factor-like uncharacterized protein